ncbi:dihydroorotate dehydrogenase [Gottfriedia solisilvae]|uniref:Dihydroorotate dehydrogenase n=1 Tax=Gottfriedia solisilvae TaxID=1516104 RepID=A0A8J3AJD7_9BACI|nr:dihydroorotate dehydrogenase [Gottfriedia solisilvae]GGI13869.1 hypothetical protein GCM10007380_20070 [Gottfriedia solisilvae]
MPDWSYHTLFKPLLSNLPAKRSREFIHQSMGFISSIPLGTKLIEFLGHMKTDEILKKEIHSITFENSVGLSSSIDPLLNGTNAFMNLGFGCIEIGPISVNKELHPTPNIQLKHNLLKDFQLEETLGIQETLQKLSKVKKTHPLFAKVQGSIDEFQLIDSHISKFVDVYVIDLTLLKQYDKNSWLASKPICLSIDVGSLSEITVEEMNKLLDSIMIQSDPLLSDVENKQLLIHAINQLHANGYDKPIFTSGGISEPIDAVELLEAGAKLVFLSHGYVLSGPGLPKRINEAILHRKDQPIQHNKDWNWYFLFGFIMFVGGLIALLISLTTIILPYDEYFLNTNKESIIQFNNRILPFMSHDRMTLSGTIMSGGILFMSLARYGIRPGYHWATKASNISAIIGFMAIFLFIGFQYFDWLHALFWLFLLPPFLIGYKKTRKLKRKPTSQNLHNHRYWKNSLIGQLAFIILGFALLIGGILISIIGMTTTFVETDLAYLCISPSQIDQFNLNLIPVISHDRAGFGGSLVSVGLLVLMISLWGFQQGKRWIWWTLLFGSLPAFITAIGVHILIGYTDFIHLLPPIVALLLLIGGLVTSYQFFHLKDQSK